MESHCGQKSHYLDLKMDFYPQWLSIQAGLNVQTKLTGHDPDFKLITCSVEKDIGD